MNDFEFEILRFMAGKTQQPLAKVKMNTTNTPVGLEFLPMSVVKVIVMLSEVLRILAVELVLEDLGTNLSGLIRRLKPQGSTEEIRGKTKGYK